MRRKIAGYLTKNRNEKDQKIAQSTHEKRIHQAEKNFFVEIQNSFLAKILCVRNEYRLFFLLLNRNVFQAK